MLRQNTALTAPEWASPTPASDFRNKIINGDGSVNQRVATTAADDVYAHDRHYALTQTAAIGVSTLTAPAAGIASMTRLTQTQAAAQRFGYAQIFEASVTYGLRGQEVTLGGKLRSSNAAPIRFAILEWTGAADVVVSDVVNDWTSANFTAGNFFKSANMTVRQVGTITPAAGAISPWSLKTTVGATANNIIVFYWTEGAAAQNSTLDQRWYVVEGDAAADAADPFTPRHIEQEWALCQRYYEISHNNALFWTGSTQAGSVYVSGTVFQVRKRAVPAIIITNYATSIMNAAGTALINIDHMGVDFQVTAAGTSAYGYYLAGVTVDAEL